jgi:hypothetical protein
MVSKALMGIWAFLDVCLLAAGAVSLAMSIVWRSPNLLLNMVISDAYLTSGMVLGIALLVTFAISIGAIVQRNHVTIGLVILNWTLIIDALGIIIIGSFVWFFTLRERDNFHRIYAAQSPETRLAIQDKLKCCGYFNSTDLAEVGGRFCVSENFIRNINNATQNFCVTPITAFADNTLTNVFTTIYGFMAVIICLFLASLCVINKRLEDERFKKIDAKRGGRGFV